VPDVQEMCALVSLLKMNFKDKESRKKND